MTAVMRYAAGDAMSTRGDPDATPVPARQPRWLQAALWVLAQGYPVSRGVLAREFALSERQASDLMHYIARRRSDVVVSIWAVETLGGGIRRATLEVLRVEKDALPPRGYRAHARHKKGGTPSARLTGQRSPEDTP
ncbi:CaiF/GrlA family transcriptional regulator [Serratia quinivorans]|uniref:CaiF/GrlA family transcriptional regulator n=2 Tax=Serratia TaxID=613 RepID=UPI00217A287A|nr:Protein of uncharacterised function (DUF1401) [Serratia quinivorans]CAI1089707.1 Protein of uncharacterised function (DUF1401) [Serratia quinivorans]CAI2121721.1 Protein of uncharacterised function (DUF1401) [Serratia quinivorans]CAI2488640.1 Protein of uncharacterised function (DUF1401) [Serratia liquefaciens]